MPMSNGGNNYDHEFMMMAWSSFFKKSYKTEQPNGSGATEWSALATGGLRSSSTLCHVMRIMMVALAMVENKDHDHNHNHDGDGDAHAHFDD